MISVEIVTAYVEFLRQLNYRDISEDYVKHHVSEDIDFCKIIRITTNSKKYWRQVIFGSIFILKKAKYQDSAYNDFRPSRKKSAQN